MRLPARPTHLIRQLVTTKLPAGNAQPTALATGIAAGADPNDVAAPTSTMTITSKSGGGGNSTNGGGNPNAVLTSGVAESKLSWWQLLCVVGGGIVVLVVAGWVYFRHRRRAQNNQKRKDELEKAQKDREAALQQREKDEELKRRENEKRSRRTRRRDRGRDSWGSSDFSEDDDDDDDSMEFSDSDESYDSVSDGGTIRPRRRRKRPGGRGRRHGRRGRGGGERRRHRRRHSYSDSEDSEDSDDSYRHRSRKKKEAPLEAATKGISSPIKEKPKEKEKDFRDSVFSTYHSMKQAAVKLKYVEAKAKLNKQLAQEEKFEAARRAKVVEANREIEMARQREQAYNSSAGSTQPLIPPVNRPLTQSSTSSGGTASLPRPPSRAMRKQSYPQDRPPPQARSQDNSSMRNRQFSTDSYMNPRDRKPQPGPSKSSVIPPVPTQRKPIPQRGATRYAPPQGIPSVPQSPRTSVYIPISHPSHRPIIPPGQLAPAPKPKAKAKPSTTRKPSGGLEIPPVGAPVGGAVDPAAEHGWGTWGMNKATEVGGTVGQSMAGVGAGVGAAAAGAKKWADRLRDRK